MHKYIAIQKISDRLVNYLNCNCYNLRFDYLYSSHKNKSRYIYFDVIPTDQKLVLRISTHKVFNETLTDMDIVFNDYSNDYEKEMERCFNIGVDYLDKVNET